MDRGELAGMLREAATDAIRYWEPRRLLFNGVLAAIVVWYFVAGWPESRAAMSLNFLLVVFLLAVLANVAYCGAYLVDVFAQISGFRELWKRVRWVVLGTGLLFAAILTRFWALAFFAPETFE